MLADVATDRLVKLFLITLYQLATCPAYGSNGIDVVVGYVFFFTVFSFFLFFWDRFKVQLIFALVKSSKHFKVPHVAVKEVEVLIIYCDHAVCNGDMVKGSLFEPGYFFREAFNFREGYFFGNLVLRPAVYLFCFLTEKQEVFFIVHQIDHICCIVIVFLQLVAVGVTRVDQLPVFRVYL